MQAIGIAHQIESHVADGALQSRAGDARLEALERRAARLRMGGTLLSALSSGLLSGDGDQTEALFALSGSLGDGKLQRRRALSSLMALAELGEPGAMSVLGWLGDAHCQRDLAGLIADAEQPSVRRVAAIRGALFVLRQSDVVGTYEREMLLKSLRDATERGAAHVSFTAAFVRASLGERSMRGLLERGALEEKDPTLLRLCLLGIESIGDAASLPFVWRVWMRQPMLRDLADAVSERLEEDLRRRKVNLLEEAVEQKVREAQRRRAAKAAEGDMVEVAV